MFQCKKITRVTELVCKMNWIEFTAILIRPLKSTRNVTLYLLTLPDALTNVYQCITLLSFFSEISIGRLWGWNLQFYIFRETVGSQLTGHMTRKLNLSYNNEYRYYKNNWEFTFLKWLNVSSPYQNLVVCSVFCIRSSPSPKTQTFTTWLTRSCMCVNSGTTWWIACT